MLTPFLDVDLGLNINANFSISSGWRDVDVGVDGVTSPWRRV
jgi:hypothetical protein